jgi:cob(I)alamin adenosyltransferase
MLTTKQGDGGYTRLADGTTVAKSTPQCCACGDLDEFNCALGLIRVIVDRYIGLRNDIYYMQTMLPKIMSEVSCANTLTLTESDLNILEKKRVTLEQKVVIPPGFTVPGDTEINARLHYARAVCRRCERSLVKLYNSHKLKNKNILIFMNRLSDYLYLLTLSVGGLT